MDDLSSLLLAAIEETERLAQACLYASHAGTWTADSETVWIRIPADDRWSDDLNHEDDVEVATTDDTMHHPFHFEWAKHIAHNDPSSVLRRCSADRRIVETYEAIRQAPEIHADAFSAMTSVLRDLAAAYGLTDHQEGE